MTPSGIETATFCFVAQHLNHCPTAVPYAQIKHRLFRKRCNHTVRLEIRLYDEDDVICDIERPSSDIIVLTVQDDE